MLTVLTRWSLVVTLATLVLNASASEEEVRNDVALGALAFADNCQKCHQLDGYGEEALYPSLHDPALLANKTLLIQTILHGRLEEGSGESVRLMPMLDYLTNKEIAAIIAFITNSWGDRVLIVSDKEVAEARRLSTRLDTSTQ